MRIKLSRILRFIVGSFVFFASLSFIFYSSLTRTTVEPITNDIISHESSSISLVSYEDPELANEEAKRVGPGEQGRAVKLVGEEKKKADQFLNQNGFNTYISDMIALDRSVADIRHHKCKEMLYSSRLPTASIVIPFFEENMNALMRTVHSSLKRSPEGLIKEIILVDDGSSRNYLKHNLDKYIKDHFPDGNVRVIHSPKREGLISARLVGARAATGDVLIFLDSHCEPNLNWLPPLLDPIARDYKTVVCPFIDVIDADTFEYRAQDEGARGAFDWELFYKRLPKLPKDRPYPEKPFDSPVMAGGLFAISTKWFWELGGYDPGLAIWGGEQYEISFKIWMCGGRMIDVPCSRIGHIYRTHPTNFPNAGVVDFVGRNFRRVAEVWMDEYKEYIYTRRPHYRAIDFGDVSEQRAVRDRLQCKPFKWFMTEVAFDLVQKYPLIDPIPIATGDIRSVADPTLCIDALGASETEPIKMNKCIRDGANHNGIQNFELSYHDDIRGVKLSDCWDAPWHKTGGSVVWFGCHGGRGNQHWALEPVNADKSNPLQLRHVGSGLCLQANMAAMTIALAPCSQNELAQRWNWETVQIDKGMQSRKDAGL